MVRRSSAGNPIKPRKVAGTKSNFSMECDEHGIKMDVNFAVLSAKEHQRVVDWLEQAHAYVAYLHTDEFAYRKKQKEAEEKNQKTHSGPKGGSSSWQRQAERMRKRFVNSDIHLEALGLTEMPADLKELNKARRVAMRKAHPDAGGSEEMAKEVNNAYEVLKAKL